MLIKVVAIGPESTGKTLLCKKLAEHFQTEWVPEFAREYLEGFGPAYQYEDLEKIAEGQVGAEDRAAENALNEEQQELLFIDTDLYVIKVWSEYVFNKCENRILTQIANRHYDLYLLCDTDIEWVSDSLREYPDHQQRNKLYHYYKDAMINQQVPWVEISGDFDQRFQKAINAIDNIIKRQV